MRQSPVRRYILNNISQHHKDIVKSAVRKFGLSRQAVLRHMKVLILDGKIEAHGRTRDRYYVLKPFVNELFEFDISLSLHEDIIGRRHIYSHLKDCPLNVRQICEYGFSQILNNAIVHSMGNSCIIRFLVNEESINLKIRDDGKEGLFSKIASYYNLDDPFCSALELTKGKVSTDFQRHTGEGIFFVSHLFDSIIVRSNGYSLKHNRANEKWELNRSKKHIYGTSVSLHIKKTSTQTIEGVMEKFSSKSDTSIFDRTLIPVNLVRAESEALMSRGQAKRLLRGLNEFKEVVFDFANVHTIGQPFADEIFRVFHSNHRDTKFSIINSTVEIEAIIKRVKRKNSPNPKIMV